MTKSEVQQQVREIWYKSPRGTVVADTAVGKTKIATGYGSDVGILQSFNERHPNSSALVVVPSKDLKRAWEKEFVERNITNTIVLTIQKLSRDSQHLTFDLLIIDEVHLMIRGNKYKRVFELVNYKYLLTLTATLPDDLEAVMYLTGKAPIIAEIGTDLALNNNYICDFQIYNLPVEMSFKTHTIYNEIENKLAYIRGIFDGYNIYNLTDVDVQYIADRNNMHKGVVYGKLKAYKGLIRKRSELFYLSNEKLYTVVDLCDRFKHRKIITFNIRTSMCDRLQNSIPGSIAIHGKTANSEELLEEYKLNKYNPLHASEKLSTGINIPEINMGIVQSFNSSSVLSKQQVGENFARIQLIQGTSLEL